MLTDGLPAPIERFLYRNFSAGPLFVKQVQEIRREIGGKPLVFAIPGAGVVEFWVLRHFLKSAYGDSYAPRYATRVWGIFAEPFRLNLRRAASAVGLAKKVSRIDVCSQELAKGRCIVLNLENKDRRKPFETPTGEQEIAYLQSQHPDVCIVPTTFVWQRRRILEKEIPSNMPKRLWNFLWSPLIALWNMTLGNPFVPHFQRKIALLSLGYRHTTLRASPVIKMDNGESPKSARRKILMAVQQERKVVLGPTFRSTRFIGETVFRDPNLHATIEAYAEQHGKPPLFYLKKSQKYFKEMAANYSYFVVDLFSWFLKKVFGNIFEGLTIKESDFEKLRIASKEGPLVFVPTHKSYVDFLMLSHLMQEKQIAPPHIIAGINLNFWPFGSIAKRGGAIFIRRSFKDKPLYGEVLRRYINALLSNKINLEFFIEGARSRNGKLAPPKFGILKMITDNYLAGNLQEKVRFVPMSIIYDRVTEDGAHRKELEGGDKVPESFSGLFKATKVLLKNFGKVHVRIGDPIAIEDWAAKEVGEDKQSTNINRLAVQKLAFEICHRINAASPITSVGIVCATMLLKPDAKWTRSEFEIVLMLLQTDLKSENIPMSPELEENFMHACRRALVRLIDDKMIEKFYNQDGGIGYQVSQKQRLGVFYYKNSAIHGLLNFAIAGLCQIEGTEVDNQDLMRLRALLQFEFFFSEKDLFVDSIHSLAERVDCAPYAFLLDDYLETIEIGIKCLIDMQDLILGKKEWHSRLMKKGKVFLAEGHVKRAESINTQAFKAFLELAQNREYFKAAQTGDELMKPATPAKLSGDLEFIRRLRAKIKTWNITAPSTPQSNHETSPKQTSLDSPEA